MKKKKVIKKVFAVIMALSVIFSYSVVAMADGEHVHDYVLKEITIAPTCTETGLGDFECSDENCESVLEKEIPALGHDWDEGTVTKEATCLDKGVMTYKCQRDACNATQTEDIPVLGHEYGTDGMCIHEGCKDSISINSDIVALIGDTTYTTLDDAVAAASGGDTVIVLQNCTTSGLNLSKNLTIKGAKGADPKITFTQYGIALWGASLTFKDCDVVMNGIGSTPYTSEWNWMSICASKDASLTLDNVSMTMNGQDADKHAIYFCSNNKLNIVNGSSLTITGYKQDALEWDGGDGGYNVNITDSTFISDHNRSGFTGTFYATITRSVVDVINSLGNGSNGSHFNITEDSVVRFNNNGSHGLSAGNLTIDDSTVEACDNGANGIHTTGTMVMGNGSDIKIQRNRCSISSQWTIPGALYVGLNGTIDETCTVNITDNRGSGIYVKAGGSLDMATGTVMRNTAEKLGFGGGIYNNGNNTVLGDKVILYNNHAENAADDIYNAEGAVIKFHAVGSDWVLDDCGHKITGWYYDNVPYIAEMSDSEPQLLSVGDGYNGGRWSVKGCELFNPVSGTASKAEVTNAYEYAETAAEGVIALKAAHGVPALPPYIPVTPESVYTVTYMDGVDDEVVFEDQSTTNLKKGDKTPAFTGEPVREGYKFIGWSPEVAETVSGDAVYYAQWEKLPEEPSVVDPSGDNDPIDDGKDIDAQPNGDADTEAKGVKTGDETMLAMWGALGLIAALGLGGALVIGRRREE